MKRLRALVRRKIFGVCVAERVAHFFWSVNAHPRICGEPDPNPMATTSFAAGFDTALARATGRVERDSGAPVDFRGAARIALAQVLTRRGPRLEDPAGSSFRIRSFDNGSVEMNASHASRSIFAVFLLLAACGGDSDSPTPTETADGSSFGDTASDGSASGPVSPFLPCLQSADCRGGEICRDLECREFCAEDDDCDGEAGTCDVSAGVCVFCLQRTDCPAGNLCRDQQCSPGCLGDTDCATGELCNFTSQLCEAGECTTDGDCAGGFRCSTSRCVEIERCDIGEMRCEAGVRSTCRSGVGFDTDPCGEGEACALVGGAVACVNERCAEEPNGCIGPTRAYECSDDLSSLTIVACDEGLTCVRGACSEQACEAGQTRCEGDSTLATCSPDGTDETFAPCADETVCRNGACIEPPPAACLTIAPTELTFGTVSVDSTAFRTIRLQSCGTEAVEVSSLVFGEPGGPFSVAEGTSFPVTVAAGGERTIPIAFQPDSIDDFSVTVAAATQTGNQPSPPARLTGSGVDAECVGRAVECSRGTSEDYSQSLDTDPGERVRCRAVGFEDAPDGRFVVTRGGEPYANVGQGAGAGTATFIAEQGDERGETYRVCFASDVAACGRLCSSVSLRNPIDPSRYISIELVWTSERTAPENSTGNDLDLHVALDGGCWESTETDVHFRSTTIDWGNPGVDDDVSLVRDDSNGNGPEIARILSQAEYDVVLGVHLWTDNRWGSNNFRVSIFHYGEELGVYEGTIVDEKSLIVVGTLRLGDTPRFIEDGEEFAQPSNAPCPIVAQ
jgi:hypothetical protein